MSIRIIECKHCDCKVSYTPCANFVLFCPECKREIYAECECGYGPVTPCSILLGQDSMGTVTENNENRYTLEIGVDGTQIKLREQYLKAIYEASAIVKGILRPKTKKWASNSFKIKKKGGCLCFYGDWFGRPKDNFYIIDHYSYQDDVLEIVFHERECLFVFEPSGTINTENEFSIYQSKMVKWSWYPYGSSEGQMNKISYELTDGKVHKISGHQEQLLERKAPYFSVLLD